MLAGLTCTGFARAQTLSAERLGVLYNLDQSSSVDMARFYAAQRGIPDANLVGLHLGDANRISPAVFAPLRKQALDSLPGAVQSLALVWSRPFAVGCMSVTTAVAAGYRPAFCEPGCGLTAINPMFDSPDWLPADTVGWLPAMLIPIDDPEQARALIQRGMASDATAPRGTVYLVSTADAGRNVRAATYPEVEASLGDRLHIVDLSAPVVNEVPAAIGYFTGAVRVPELPLIDFLPGAVADHLTSTGGVLSGGGQMPAGAWLNQGATASYGNVTEPCNRLQKFPNLEVLMRHYTRGETVLEAYWKSVAMPGQGLFIGEPLARPFAVHRR